MLGLPLADKFAATLYVRNRLTRRVSPPPGLAEVTSEPLIIEGVKFWPVSFRTMTGMTLHTAGAAMFVTNDGVIVEHNGSSEAMCLFHWGPLKSQNLYGLYSVQKAQQKVR